MLLEFEWLGTLLNAIMRNSVSLVLDIEFRSREMQAKTIDNEGGSLMRFIISLLS
jgi:hypothetical protein